MKRIALTLLAAGISAVGLVAGEASAGERRVRTIEQGPQLRDNVKRCSSLNLLIDRPVTVEFIGLLLGVEVEPNLVTEDTFSLAGCLRAGENPAESGFACSIHAHQGNPITTFDNQVKVLEHLDLVVTFTDCF